MCPTHAEIALIAIAIVSSLNAIDSARWKELVLACDHEYGDGSGWKAPSAGVWARPSGEIHVTVEQVCTDDLHLEGYRRALEAYGAVTAAPPLGTMKCWFSALRGSRLLLQRTKRPAKRAPYIAALMRATRCKARIGTS